MAADNNRRRTPLWLGPALLTPIAIGLALQEEGLRRWVLLFMAAVLVATAVQFFRGRLP